MTGLEALVGDGFESKSSDVETCCLFGVADIPSYVMVAPVFWTSHLVDLRSQRREARSFVVFGCVWCHSSLLPDTI